MDKELLINLDKVDVAFSYSRFYPLYKFDKYLIKKDAKSNKNFLCIDKNSDFIEVNDYNHPIRETDMLCELYNLGEILDKHKKNEECYPIIVDWCKTHFFPYNLYIINANINPLDEETLVFEYDECEKYCYFGLDKFINDLGKLYRATKLYLCIYYIYTCDDEFVMDINDNSNLYPPITEFEQYKKALRQYVLKADLTKEQLDRFNALPEFVKDFSLDDIYEEIAIDMNGKRVNDPEKYEQSLLKKKEFAQLPYENFDNIYNNFIQTLPQFKMKLEYDSNKQMPISVPVVENIFDIGWYGLIQVMTTNVSQDKENSILHVCVYCGKLYIKKGRNQKCCQSPECLKEGKRIAKRNSRARLKQAEKRPLI